MDKKRSSAAKRGWAKRRKKQKLIEAMQRARESHAAQPIGWIERRNELREIDGEMWTKVVIEYSEDAYQAERLAALAELEIDFLTRDELYDYLSWLSEEFNIEISDMYRMYLGYKVGED